MAVDGVTAVDGVMVVDGVKAVDGVMANGWMVEADGLLTSLFKGIGGDEDSAAAIPEVNTNFNCSSMPLILFRISSNRRF